MKIIINNEDSTKNQIIIQLFCNTSRTYIQWYKIGSIGIEYITPIKKSRYKPDEVRYYFMIHFQSGLVIKVQIYTSEIEVPPILLSIRELFINGIGHSYITLYQDEMMDVQIIRYYHKEF